MFSSHDHSSLVSLTVDYRLILILLLILQSPLIVFVEGRARFRLHGRMNMYARAANATQTKELVRNQSIIGKKSINI